MSTTNVYYAGALPHLELVARVNRKVLVGIDRRMRSSGFSLPQRRLLLAIGRRPGSTHAELSHELAMARSLVSKTVTHLVAEQLVETAPTTRHRAQRLLKLTPTGVTVAEELDELNKAAFVKEAEDLSPAEATALMAAMDRPTPAAREVIAGDRVTLRMPDLERLVWMFSQVGRIGVDEFGWKEAFLVGAAKGQILHLTQAVRADDQVAWYAEYHNKIVGGCFLTFAADPEIAEPGLHDVHAWIGAIFVLPGYRSRGVGERLVNAAIEAAEELTAVSVSIRAAKRQTALINLARAQGFKPRANTIEDWRTGTRELWRDFTLKLPRRASKVRDRQQLGWGNKSPS